MNEDRLQKILARAGVTSRRKAEELIREGRVTVNGAVAAIGDKADLAKDAVKLDGKRIELPAVHRYLLLNKPRGVMSTVVDPGGRPTVLDLVPPGLRKALFPVGRLDFDTEGLILLTDDGDFAQRVAHPRHGCWKTYEVKVKGRPPAKDIERLEQGIPLEGRRTAPCRIRPRFGEGGRRPTEEDDGNSWWIVELGEGRTRQIRELFFRIGHRVQKLRRVGIGPLFDPYLPVGGLRELGPEDVERLNRAAGGPKPDGVGRKKTAAGEAAPARKAAAPRRRREEKPMTLAEVAKKQRSEAKRTVRVHARPVPRPSGPPRPAEPRATAAARPLAARPPRPAGGPVSERPARPERAATHGKASAPAPARPSKSARAVGRPSTAASAPARAGKPPRAGERPSAAASATGRTSKPPRPAGRPSAAASATGRTSKPPRPAGRPSTAASAPARTGKPPRAGARPSAAAGKPARRPTGGRKR